MTRSLRRVLDLATGLLIFAGSLVAVLAAVAGWFGWTLVLPFVLLFGGQHGRLSGWAMVLGYFGGIVAAVAVAGGLTRRFDTGNSGSAIRLVAVSGLLLLSLLTTLYNLPRGLHTG